MPMSRQLFPRPLQLTVHKFSNHSTLHNIRSCKYLSLVLELIYQSINILHVRPETSQEHVTCLSITGAQTVEVPEAACTRTEFISVLNVKTLGSGFRDFSNFLTFNLQVITYSVASN